MRSSVVHYRARLTSLQHLAHTVGDHRVLAECDAHERLVEAKGTQDWQRIGGRLAGELIGRGDHTASAGLHQTQRDVVEAKLGNAVFFEGLEAFQHDVRTEAL